MQKVVEWRLIASNPVICSAPTRADYEAVILDADSMRMALDDIEDELLHLAVHFTFICSLRIGELLGATWDCIDFEKKEFRVNKIFRRVNKSSIELANEVYNVNNVHNLRDLLNNINQCTNGK